jgi:hypothetical protein
MKKTAAWWILSLAVRSLDAQQPPPPIIDMHLHAAPADTNGPPPTGICAPMREVWTLDPAQPWAAVFGASVKKPPCAKPIWGPTTDEEVMGRSIDILKRRNIYAVTSGSGPLLDRWKQAGGGRILPALEYGKVTHSTPTPAEVRQWFQEKRYLVFAEVALQYDGVSPSDSAFEPYLAAAEDLDVPMGIHIGTGPPGAVYLPGMEAYRGRLHSALVLEEALIRHPRLRVYIMHAGWPMIDDLLTVLWAHPQVHVDVGVISYILPRAEFHRYLQRIVEAGFGKRVMFGSDQMNWPDAIGVAIQAIEGAPFLSAEQKRDILFHNAARFLRLSESQIADMRAAKTNGFR